MNDNNSILPSPAFFGTCRRKCPHFRYEQDLAGWPAVQGCAIWAGCKGVRTECSPAKKLGMTFPKKKIV
jgi:hypothetical protein